MRINSRKIRKILGRVRTAPKRIFETLLHSRSSKTHWNECNIHNFLFDLKIKQKFFLYYISCKKINVGKILKLCENCYLIILSIHILKLEISGCDRYSPW
jgi:hypothetical protein